MATSRSMLAPLREDRLPHRFHDAVADSGAEIAVIEGCMGLHDGRDGRTDAGSTAQASLSPWAAPEPEPEPEPARARSPAVAKWLGAPVLLVLDCWALSRSAAAMVHGYRTMRPARRRGRRRS